MCTGPDCQKGCRWDFVMPCKVCEVNHNDATPKRACYCTLCGAYICQEHINDPIARTIAATTVAVQAVVKKAKRILNIKKENGEPTTPTT